MEGKAGQGLFRKRGVVLRRRDTNEGDRSVYVLLREEGPVWLIAPGGARGKVRFGGATDPLVWGTFHIYRGPNRWYLREVDVRKDFLLLRKHPSRIRRAAEWAASLVKYTLPGHASDDLLPIFYWSLCVLESGRLREDLADWRFYWRWLRSWGLAPNLERCQECGAVLGEALFRGESLLCAKCSRGGRGVKLSARDRSELFAVSVLDHEKILAMKDLPGIDPRKAQSCTRMLLRTLSDRV